MGQTSKPVGGCFFVVCVSCKSHDVLMLSEWSGEIFFYFFGRGKSFEARLRFSVLICKKDMLIQFLLGFIIEDFTGLHYWP